MELVIGLIILVCVLIHGAPASRGLKEGRDYYWQCRRRHREESRKEAEAKDNFFYNAGDMTNEYFYSDGSLRYDPITKKSYPKGQYYCRSDGVTAEYKTADSRVERPK